MRFYTRCPFAFLSLSPLKQQDEPAPVAFSLGIGILSTASSFFHILRPLHSIRAKLSRKQTENKHTQSPAATCIWNVQSQPYLVVKKCRIIDYFTLSRCLSAASWLSPQFGRKMTYALDMRWPWSLRPLLWPCVTPHPAWILQHWTHTTRAHSRTHILPGLGEGEQARDRWVTEENCKVIARSPLARSRRNNLSRRNTRLYHFKIPLLDLIVCTLCFAHC